MPKLKQKNAMMFRVVVYDNSECSGMPHLNQNTSKHQQHFILPSTHNHSLSKKTLANNFSSIDPKPNNNEAFLVLRLKRIKELCIDYTSQCKLYVCGLQCATRKPNDQSDSDSVLFK